MEDPYFGMVLNVIIFIEYLTIQVWSIFATSLDTMTIGLNAFTHKQIKVLRTFM